MPRDGAAALKAWAKRKRAEGGARDLPGLSTIAAVRLLGGGPMTRAAVLRAYGAVGQAKDKLARNRLAAGELPSVGPRRMATGTSGVSLSTPPSGAKGWPRPSGSKDSKSMPIEPSVHGPKPKGGPMAGMQTAARKEIGAKAAAKRKANKEAQVRAEEGLKRAEGDAQGQKAKAVGVTDRLLGVAALAERLAAEAKDAKDLFGRKRDASVIEQDGSPLPRADISKSKTTDAQFFSDLDKHTAPLVAKVVTHEEIIHEGIMPKVLLTYADGTQGAFKGDHDSFFGHRVGIKNRNFQPGAREEAAYALDKVLNLGVVPMGAVDKRNLPSDPGRQFAGGNVTGSRHQWADGDQFRKVFTGQKGSLNEKSVARVAVLDVLVGHTDRHSKNALINSKGELIGIDNGHTFTSQMKKPDGTSGAFIGFRADSQSVLGRIHSAGIKADAGALREVRGKLNRIDVNAFAKRYKMDESEKQGLTKRLAWLKKNIDQSTTPDAMRNRPAPNDFLARVISQNQW